jgi:polyribonucleotide nucleotidyltransferase
MRLAKTIAAIAIALTVGLPEVPAAMAQQQPRLQIQMQQAQAQPRQQMRQQRPRLRQQQVKPRLLLIPPSEAARIAQQMNPGAKLLNIKPRGDMYIATMRQGNQVFRVPIPGN